MVNFIEESSAIRPSLTAYWRLHKINGQLYDPEIYERLKENHADCTLELVGTDGGVFVTKFVTK